MEFKIVKIAVIRPNVYVAFSVGAALFRVLYLYDSFNPYSALCGRDCFIAQLRFSACLFHAMGCVRNNSMCSHKNLPCSSGLLGRLALNGCTTFHLAVIQSRELSVFSQCFVGMMDILARGSLWASLWVAKCKFLEAGIAPSLSPTSPDAHRGRGDFARIVAL